jgi:chromosome segregation ATPase
MSETPRTTKSEAIRILAAYGHAACDRVEQLETELADKDRQLAEARAEIERLNKDHNDALDTIFAMLIAARGEDCTIEVLHAEMNAVSTKPSGYIRHCIAKRDKLVKQMREALSLVMEGAIHDFHYACQHCDNCLCWGCQKVRVKAALAAERGE